MWNSRRALALCLLAIAAAGRAAPAFADDAKPANAPATAKPANAPTAAKPANAPTAAQPANAPAPATRPPATAPATALPDRGRLLVTVGASAFTVIYLASALGATTGYDSDATDRTSRGALWIPAVGPFIAIGYTRAAGVGVVFALDGVAQIGSIAIFAMGLVTPRPVLVRPAADDSARRGFTVSVDPLVGGGTSGATLFGTF
jgi:hypothetical protein